MFLLFILFGGRLLLQSLLISSLSVKPKHEKCCNINMLKRIETYSTKPIAPPPLPLHSLGHRVLR